MKANFQLPLICVVALLLSGCGLLQTKAELPPNEYQQIAAARVLIHKCAVNGLMDLELAAFGARRLEWLLDERFNYDHARMERAMSGFSNQKFTRQHCNGIAVAIHQARQQDAESARRAAEDDAGRREVMESFRSNRPIYCTRMGATVMCR